MIINYCINNKIDDYLIIGDLNLNQNYIPQILKLFNNIKIPYNIDTNNIITCPYNNEILDYFYL